MFSKMIEENGFQNFTVQRSTFQSTLKKGEGEGVDGNTQEGIESVLHPNFHRNNLQIE